VGAGKDAPSATGGVVTLGRLRWKRRACWCGRTSRNPMTTSPNAAQWTLRERSERMEGAAEVLDEPTSEPYITRSFIASSGRPPTVRMRDGR